MCSDKLGAQSNERYQLEACNFFPVSIGNSNFTSKIEKNKCIDFVLFLLSCLILFPFSGKGLIHEYNVQDTVYEGNYTP